MKSQMAPSDHKISQDLHPYHIRLFGKIVDWWARHHDNHCASVTAVSPPNLKGPGPFKSFRANLKGPDPITDSEAGLLAGIAGISPGSLRSCRDRRDLAPAAGTRPRGCDHSTPRGLYFAMASLSSCALARAVSIGGGGGDSSNSSSRSSSGGGGILLLPVLLLF